VGIRIADILAAGRCTTFTRSIPTVVYRAFSAIKRCHTWQMGGHAVVCPNGHIEAVAYNACRNRSCPHCAAYRVQLWFRRQVGMLLGCAHHHIIFTIPHELSQLWLLNYRKLANLLFKSSRDAVFELAADPQYLGAAPGVIMALHTAGQQLPIHPHTHCLATAGGIDSEGRWVPARRKIFLPQQPLKELFKGKFLYGLRGLAWQGKLRVPDGWTQADLLALCRKLDHKRWNVRVCERYENPGAVLSYLGRYLHGGPFAESRLLGFDGQRVTFRYKDYRDVGPDGPRQKETSLSRDEFVRRYLQHVPPKGFHLARCYGIYRHGGNTRQLRERLRQALPLAPEVQERLAPKADWPPWWFDPPEQERDGMQSCSVCGLPLTMVAFRPRAGPVGLAA